MGSAHPTLAPLAPGAQHLHTFGLAVHVCGEIVVRARMAGGLEHAVTVVVVE